jgi:hypothetical protein
MAPAAAAGRSRNTLGGGVLLLLASCVPGAGPSASTKVTVRRRLLFSLPDTLGSAGAGLESAAGSMVPGCVCRVLCADQQIYQIQIQPQLHMLHASAPKSSAVKV